MKQVYSLLIVILVVPFFASGQDEGIITKKERIAKSSNVFFNLGPSFTLGKNIGDYSTGINIEAGFLKRVNRVLSIGPSISYIRFNYDPAKTRSEDPQASDLYVGNTEDTGGGDFNDWHKDYDQYGLDPDMQWDFGYLLTLEGGDVSLISLSVNIKLNLVPIKDNTFASVYLFAKPFITNAKRGEVSGSGERWVYETYEDEETDILYLAPFPPYAEENTWYRDGEINPWNAESYPALAAKSMISGGVFLGPGVELMPAKTVTVFAQAAFGYTFPISFVSTKAYDHTLESYLNEEFPIVKKGFASLNVQVGVSFNF